MAAGVTGEGVEREHDQRVADEHRERLAELDMHRRLAAPQIRVVETGQVVMHQGGAMQHLDRGPGGVCSLTVAVAARARHGER